MPDSDSFNVLMVNRTSDVSGVHYVNHSLSGAWSWGHSESGINASVVLRSKEMAERDARAVLGLAYDGQAQKDIRGAGLSFKVWDEESGSRVGWFSKELQKGSVKTFENHDEALLDALRVLGISKK